VIFDHSCDEVVGGGTFIASAAGALIGGSNKRARRGGRNSSERNPPAPPLRPDEKRGRRGSLANLPASVKQGDEVPAVPLRGIDTGPERRKRGRMVRHMTVGLLGTRAFLSRNGTRGLLSVCSPLQQCRPCPVCLVWDFDESMQRAWA
jgi:hypothetical protein